MPFSKKIFPPKQAICLLTVMTVLITCVAAEIVSYSRNTLNVHPEWTSGNLLLASPSMGAAFLNTTRHILKNNRLNLHEWHGFQEILLNKVLQLGSMQLKLQLGENAYVCLIYNKNRDSFSGVRLSRNPLYGNIFFKADTDGKFIEKQPVTNLNIDNKWHEVELRFHQAGPQLIWDGVVTQSIPAESLKEQVTGFRSGGPFSTLIDDVKIKNYNDEVIITENFRNGRSYWQLFLVLFVVGACVLGGVFFATSIAGVDPVVTANWTFLGQALLSAMLVFYLCFDYCVYSHFYPYDHVTQWKSVSYRLSSVETMRARLFSLFDGFNADPWSAADGAREVQAKDFLQSAEYDLAPAGFLETQAIWSNATGEDFRVFPIPELINFFNTMPLKSYYKILFLGTSQTWGEGAALIKEQMVFQAYRSLRTRDGDNRSYLAVNAGQRASDSQAMLKILNVLSGPMQPDMVVVNLSNNDEPSGFKKNLLEMLAVSTQNKAKFILVKEANSPDSDNMRLIKNHQVIDEIVLERNIPCIDMQAYLCSPGVVDSGFLWWDFVHLTAYGQAIAGKEMAREIHDVLKIELDPLQTKNRTGLGH